MPGLPKLLVVILVLAAAWYLKRWFAAAMARGQQQRPSPAPQRTIEDLVACPECGAYVAAAGPGCGRRECPRR